MLKIKLLLTCKGNVNLYENTYHNPFPWELESQAYLYSQFNQLWTLISVGSDTQWSDELSISSLQFKYFTTNVVSWPSSSPCCITLDHWGWMTDLCISEIDHHCLMPSHYLNQCWHMVNWMMGKIKLTKFVLTFKCFSRKCVQNGGHFICVSMC